LTWNSNRAEPKRQQNGTDNRLFQPSQGLASTASFYLLKKLLTVPAGEKGGGRKKKAEEQAQGGHNGHGLQGVRDAPGIGHDTQERDS
jgi:hypothetical protein